MQAGAAEEGAGADGGCWWEGRLGEGAGRVETPGGDEGRVEEQGTERENALGRGLHVFLWLPAGGGSTGTRVRRI